MVRACVHPAQHNPFRMISTRPGPVEGGGPRRPTAPSQKCEPQIVTHIIWSSRFRDKLISGLTCSGDHIWCGVIPCGSGPAGKDETLNDLAFDIHLGGRAAKPLSAEAVREITQSDLALLSTERGIQPSHVQRLSSRHHALARCIATGMSAEEAGLCTGYTPSRISVMKADPAFAELVAFYTAGKGEAVQDLADKMAAIAKDTADELHDRLLDAPATFSNNELQEQLKIVADRTGHGPASRNTNVNINVNLGDRLKAARERAASERLPAKIAGSGSEQGHASPTPLLELKANR